MDIVQIVRRDYPNIRVAVIGEEYIHNYVEDRIKMRDLIGKVEYFGRLSNIDVLTQMQNSKILIHTSDFESQGYVMLEARACGMHVISKQVGIAKNQKQHSIANSSKEFVELVLLKLQGQIDHRSDIPYPISDTVKQYVKLYESH